VLQLTRLSGPVFALNPDLIERAEATPDTVVTLVNGSKYVILESLEELIELIHNYRAGLVSAAQAAGGFAPTGAFSQHHQPAKQTPQRRDPNAGATVVALHPGDE
jgi:flagellar protein FlbD